MLNPLPFTTFVATILSTAKETLLRDRTLINGTVRIMDRNRGGGRKDEEGTRGGTVGPGRGWKEEKAEQQLDEMRAGEHGRHKVR